MSKFEATLGRVGGAVESILVGLAGGLAPWAMDAPVAYLAGRNIVEVLGWPVWLGWIAGIGTELLGLACTGEALKFRDYNATKAKLAPRAPEGLAWLMTIIYFVGGLVLALLARVAELESFALIVFPVLGAVGTFVHAMRQDHRRRLAEAAEAKAERRADAERRLKATTVAQAEAQKRKEERQESAPLAQDGPRTMPDSVPTADGRQQRTQKVPTGEAVLAFFAANPDATQEQAAETIGVRRQTVGYWLDKMNKELAVAATAGDNGEGR